MSSRPLSLDIVTPTNGQPHLRIRAAGNRAVLAQTETYTDARSAANVVHLLVEAIQSGAFVVRYVSEDKADEALLPETLPDTLVDGP